MIRKVVVFFDKLEDRVRISLSHRPILYALIGAIGVILVWKGVWETAELFSWLHGPGSVVLGVLLLLVTGLFVSFFIGDSIIMSGFKKEKKLAEKTELELKSEREIMQSIEAKLEHIEKDVEELMDNAENK